MTVSSRVPPPLRRGLAFAAALALGAAGVVVGPRGAAAQSQDQATNDFAVDLFRGPVLAPLRVTGLAGAYAGVGEGISGLPANAASPAVRSVYAIDAIDYDVAASLSVPLPIAEPNDFDNSGERDTDDSVFIYATGGAMAQLGPLGAGALIELERYSIEVGGQSTTTLIARYHGLMGLALGRGGTVIVGGGVRGLTMGIDAPDATLTLAGIAPQVGLLVRPESIAFRVGVTARGPVDAGALGEGAPVGNDGVRRLGGLVLPDRVVLPWELESGFALQLGPRPFSRRLPDEEEELAAARSAAAGKAPGSGNASDEEARAARRRQRIDEARSMPREHLLFTGALLVTGAVDGAVGLEAFLAQARRGAPTPGSSGADVNFSPRIGMQAEPLANWVQTRFGTYYEPNRFGGTGRQHFTFGADLRVWSTRLFGLAPDGVTYSILSAVDLAPRYESISLGIGVWR